MPGAPDNSVPVGSLPLLTGGQSTLSEARGALAWRRLRPLPRGTRLPQPPPEDDPVILGLLRYAKERADLEPLGSKRVGRQVRVWDISPANGGEPWEWASVEPRQWDRHHIPAMYRAALRIARNVGFDPLADAAWVFCDDGGDWWILDDRSPRLALDDQGPMAWRLSLQNQMPGDPEPPRELIEDFGGPDGPLSWALWVIGLAVGLRDDNALRLKRVAEIAKLTAMPEWRELAKAVRAGGDPASIEGLKMLEAGVITEGKIAVFGPLEWGFMAGQELGFFQAADSVVGHESRRVASTAKATLRTALREIALAEYAAQGAWRPYVLAKTLISEQDSTERGRLLMGLGMPSENRLGVLLNEEFQAGAGPES